MVYTASEFFTT